MPFPGKPFIPALVYILIFIGITCFNIWRGYSEDIVILKSAGLLLMMSSVQLYKAHTTEFLKTNRGWKVMAFSLLWGMIFAAGMFIVVSWKPDNYERGDLVLFLCLSLIFSYAQYGMFVSKIKEQTESANQV